MTAQAKAALEALEDMEDGLICMMWVRQPSSEPSSHFYLFLSCSDFFLDPFVLPCGHSFCGFCIATWWKNQGHPTPECGTCRTPLATDSQFFIRDYVLQHAVELLINALMAHGHPHWKDESAYRARERRLKQQYVLSTLPPPSLTQTQPPGVGRSCGLKFRETIPPTGHMNRRMTISLLTVELQL